MILIVTVLTFLTVTLTLIGIYSLLTGQQNKVNNRLDKYLANEPTIALERIASGEDKDQIAAKKDKRLMLRLNQFFISYSVTKKLDRELDRSNLPFKASEFIILILVILIILALLGVFLFNNLVLRGLILGGGVVLPYLYLKYSQKQRLKKFNTQINDSLTIISNSLKAGYSFFQALEMVTKEMEPPISEEFTLVLKKMNLGASPQEALRDLTVRIGSDDLDLVVTAVLIQRQVGGNLSEILDKISVTIRERIRIEGKINTLTAQGRISGIIVALLPIGLGGLLFILNQEYMIPLFTSSLGKMMIAIGIFSQLIGIILIKKIIEIKL